MQGRDIEIKDIDEFTTREEVLEALQSTLGDTILRIECVRSLRKAFRDTQIAAVRLGSQQATNLIEASTKIRWICCRVRKKI